MPKMVPVEKGAWRRGMGEIVTSRTFCLSDGHGYGQNINLPVCGFLQLIYLKDADLRKDVPFGGLDDE